MILPKLCFTKSAVNKWAYISETPPNQPDNQWFLKYTLNLGHEKPMLINSADMSHLPPFTTDLFNSLNGYEVTPNDLHACYWLKNMDKVILKSEDRKLKRSIQINRKVLWQKSLGLSQIKFSSKFFICKNRCYDNQKLSNVAS